MCVMCLCIHCASNTAGNACTAAVHAQRSHMVHCVCLLCAERVGTFNMPAPQFRPRRRGRSSALALPHTSYAGVWVAGLMVTLSQTCQQCAALHAAQTPARSSTLVEGVYRSNVCEQQRFVHNSFLHSSTVLDSSLPRARRKRPLANTCSMQIPSSSCTSTAPDASSNGSARRRGKTVRAASYDHLHAAMPLLIRYLLFAVRCGRCRWAEVCRCRVTQFCMP